MAAAYAALVSLNFMIDQIQHSSLKKKPNLVPLQEILPFLQSFLETYSQGSSQQIQYLEKEITDVCHEAEDAIESHVLDQFLVKSGDKKSSVVLDADQQKIVEGLDSIKITDGGRECEAEDVTIESHDVEKSSLVFSEYLQTVMDKLHSIKETATKMIDVKTESQPPKSYTLGGSSKSAPGGDNSTIVGFDEHLNSIKKMLTDSESDLRVLPIVGMGGLGKTTLTLNICDDQLIKDHFEIHLWCTISQSYNVRDIFLRFLHDLGILYETGTEPKSNNELGDKLYKTLSGRKYLIVLDDVWSNKIWDPIKRFLPNDRNGSQVIITTRLKSVASYSGSCEPYLLGFLNKEESWRLLNDKVLLENGSPLEDIGRKIASSCKGLPLAIVVTGGLLAKSNRTHESWKYVAKSLSSIINSENDEYCHKILSLSYDNLPVHLKPCFLFMGVFPEDYVLSLSYDNLPVHLKPCFLFMGVFPEDYEVRVSTLVKLWVAEGFLKGTEAQCLEESAMEYLKDLIERNLILVGKPGSCGNFKSIRIHDLLRDLCLKEAKKLNFLCVRRFHAFHIPNTLHNLPARMKTNRSNSIYRTVIDSKHKKSLYPVRSVSSEFSRLKLLSELNVVDVNSPEKNLLLIGSRCLAMSADDISITLDSLQVLWNLQSMITRKMPGAKQIVLPPEIWEMPLVRHLEIPNVVLPNPPDVELISGKAHHVLENMQTLQDVHDFNFSLDVQRRIPNLKKLKLTYKKDEADIGWPFPDSHCRVHLVHLCKLESLGCTLHINISMAHISFPLSLKKLALNGGKIPWEDMTTIGQLPNLVVLRVHNDAFIGKQWTTAEGEFGELKLLHLENVSSLENWETESSHFPKLQRLSFCNIWGLKDILPCFEGSTTLEFMSFEFCSTSLVDSAKQLQSEEAEIGNTSIQVKEQLSCDTKDQLVVKLEEDLRQLKTIVANLMDEQRKDKRQSELAKKIQDLIYDAEDISDTYMTQQDLTWFNKLYQIAKDVELQLDQNKVYSATLTVANGGDHHKYIYDYKHKCPHIVGFETEAAMFVDLLTQESEQLEILSVIGMAGLGKTAFAWKVYESETIKFEFPVRIWINISEKPNMRKVFLDILSVFTSAIPEASATNEELVKTIKGHLEDGKYLIVMDDIWTIDVWRMLKSLLSTTNKWGRVLLTTRNLNVGRIASQQGCHNLRFLTVRESWELLQYEVFSKLDDVPQELSEVCWNIAIHCRGLPLSVVVIGGILAEKTSRLNDSNANASIRKEWEGVSMTLKTYLARDVKIVLRCIISLNYDKLPYKFKNCFLHLGIFPKDADIPVKKLIQLWIAEGLVADTEGKRLEEVALNNLKVLINRNLVMVRKAKLDGEPKICQIHDSVREICREEGMKLNLFEETIKPGQHPDTVKIRRLCIHSDALHFFARKPELPKARSFTSFNVSPMILEPIGVQCIADAFVLLRVYDAKDMKFRRFPGNLVKQLNHLRYLTLAVASGFDILPASVTNLWNLQTLIVDTPSSTLEIEGDIWKMKHLRHIQTNVSIILSKKGEGDDGGKELQTLTRLSPVSCTYEVCKKATSLLNLGIQGDLRELGDNRCLAELDSLNKLKLVHEVSHGGAADNPLRHLPDRFPPKLRMLVLSGTRLDWAKMSVLSAIGTLKVLKLKEQAFLGSTWEAVGTGFTDLICLDIGRTDLKHWTADRDYFPELRFLYINNCEKLSEIPATLGKKLEVLSLEHVSVGAIRSAKKIVENEQRERKRVIRLDISAFDRNRRSFFLEAAKLGSYIFSTAFRKLNKRGQ